MSGTIFISNKEKEYSASSQVKNPVYHFRPERIYYCYNERDIKAAVNDAINENAKIRVRSGGHNHAGLSSGNGVFIIDTSNMNSISKLNNVITVGPGVTVESMAEYSKKHNILFPIGGCDDVCLGGFVLGGGWGRFSRKMGLGCDSLASLNIVDGQGKLKILKGDELKSFRGGGGGNFGVVTSMTFDFARQGITSVKSDPMPFSFSWAVNDNMLVPNTNISGDEIINRFCSEFPEYSDITFTTAARIISTRPFMKKSGLRVLIDGWYISPAYEDDEMEKQDIEDQMILLLGKNIWDAREKSEDEYRSGDPFRTLGPKYSGNKILANLFKFTKKQGVDDFLVYACGNEHYPHVIDSAIPDRAIDSPQTDAEKNGIRQMMEYILETNVPDGATLYISFHSLGGVIKDDIKSVFDYRNKPYIIQIQGWWETSNISTDQADIYHWTKQVRDFCKSWAPSKFINFVGLDLQQSGTEANNGAVKLYWNTDSLLQLKETKAELDPVNRFNAIHLTN